VSTATYHRIVHIEFASSCQAAETSIKILVLGLICHNGGIYLNNTVTGPAGEARSLLNGPLSQVGLGPLRAETGLGGPRPATIFKGDHAKKKSPAETGLSH
jgi:hypothetical protein